MRPRFTVHCHRHYSHFGLHGISGQLSILGRFQTSHHGCLLSGYQHQNADNHNNNHLAWASTGVLAGTRLGRFTYKEKKLYVVFLRNHNTGPSACTFRPASAVHVYRFWSYLTTSSSSGSF